MKKVLFMLAGLILSGFTVNADSYNNKTNASKAFYSDYGNAFIFVENGVEFSVFRDGQFDFNILRNHSNLGVNISSPHVNISFNSGYNYNAFVQYDEFGAVIQVENIPVFYDFYGRISQAGNVNIHYNNFGHISRVGNLRVHYNRFNHFSHYTGFINVHNRRYISRPWHRFYSAPAFNHCVVYTRPYRQYYRPVRYVYSRPFQNNFRRPTAVSLRRGNLITRNRSYATANRNSRNVTRVNTNVNRRQHTLQNSPTVTSRRNNTRTPSNAGVTRTTRDQNTNSSTNFNIPRRTTSRAAVTNRTATNPAKMERTLRNKPQGSFRITKNRSKQTNRNARSTNSIQRTSRRLM